MKPNSLRNEELHGELAALLYGIEATGATPAESAAVVLLARLHAHRDIKGQIERARDDTEAPTDAEDKAGGDSSVEWIVDPIRQAWKWVVD